MNTIHTIIRSDASRTDAEITDLIRASVLERAAGERTGWFRQLELSLDGYGGALLERAQRVRTLLQQLETEMASGHPL